MGEVIRKSDLFFRQPRLAKQMRRMFDFAFQEAVGPEMRALKEALLSYCENGHFYLLPVGGVATEVDFAFCKNVDKDLNAMPIEDANELLTATYARMDRELGMRLHCTLAYKLCLPHCSNTERHRLVMPCFERLAYIWSRLVPPVDIPA